MDSLSSLKEVIGVHIPDALKYLSPVLGAGLAFFNVQVFTALMIMLAIDIASGLWKAKVLGKLNSRFFGNSFNRMAYYSIIYVVMHILTLSIPLGVFSSVPEAIVMTGYLMKEALSVLENVKAIQVAQGYETPFIDQLIKRLGMDIDKIANEILTSPTAQKRLSDKAEREKPAEVPAEPETPALGAEIVGEAQSQKD